MEHHLGKTHLEAVLEHLESVRIVVKLFSSKEEFTFLGSRGRCSRGIDFVFASASAFHMNLFSFAEFSTMLALRDWSSFFLYFKEGPFGMDAGGRSVTFDAGFATEH